MFTASETLRKTSLFLELVQIHQGISPNTFKAGDNRTHPNDFYDQN